MPSSNLSGKTILSLCKWSTLLGYHQQFILKWLQSLKELEGRLARWALSLQAYSSKIKHQFSANHKNADCLSRLPMIAILSPEADRLYELIDKPDLWNLELREI